MSKRRKTREPELPLFDLPLYDDPQDDGIDELALRDEAAEPVPVPEPTAAAAPKRSRKRRKKRPEPEGPLLFSEEELTAGTARQEPSRSATGPSAASEEAEDIPVGRTPGGRTPGGRTPGGRTPGGRTPGGRTPDSAALVQDRLLGGLADLTIHIATLGLMVVAVQLMGIPVALADWPAFAGLAVIFSFLYSVIPLAFWGHTPGMAWVGHAARSEGDEPLSFGQTAMRWAGALFTVVLLGLPLLLALQKDGSLADRLSDSKTVQLD